VPGLHVPEVIVERMRIAETQGRAADEGMTIACEIAVAVRPHVHGVKISTAAGALKSGLGVMRALADCAEQR